TAAAAAAVASAAAAVVARTVERLSVGALYQPIVIPPMAAPRASTAAMTLASRRVAPSSTSVRPLAIATRGRARERPSERARDRGQRRDPDHQHVAHSVL